MGSRLTKDPGLCPVRWCAETADHDGPHRSALLDTNAMNVKTGRAVITQVWLQGESARTRGIVLVTGECETGLTWPQVAALEGVFAHADRRWGMHEEGEG